MRTGSWPKLKLRLEAFALAVHPDKTRIIEFGRFAHQNRWLRRRRPLLSTASALWKGGLHHGRRLGLIGW
jgi:hypothetical protein